MSSTSPPPPGAGAKQENETHLISQSSISHFQSHPWTSSFLRSTHHSLVPAYSRIPKASGEDYLLATTLATPSTIPHLLTLEKKTPLQEKDIPPTRPDYAFPPNAREKPPPAPKIAPDVIALIDLGAPGINGHPSTAHGGILCMLLDEITSLATSVHVPNSRDGKLGKLYTVQLDTRFRAPVIVPGVAVIKAWCVALEGRKMWMRGQLLQEEPEGEGGEGKGQLEWVRRKVVCAEAYAVFVRERDGGKL